MEVRGRCLTQLNSASGGLQKAKGLCYGARWPLLHMFNQLPVFHRCSLIYFRVFKVPVPPFLHSLTTLQRGYWPVVISLSFCTTKYRAISWWFSGLQEKAGPWSAALCCPPLATSNGQGLLLSSGQCEISYTSISQETRWACTLPKLLTAWNTRIPYTGQSITLKDPSKVVHSSKKRSLLCIY